MDRLHQLLQLTLVELHHIAGPGKADGEGIYAVCSAVVAFFEPHPHPSPHPQPRQQPTSSRNQTKKKLWYLSTDSENANSAYEEDAQLNRKSACYTSGLQRLRIYTNVRAALTFQNSIYKTLGLRITKRHSNLAIFKP